MTRPTDTCSTTRRPSTGLETRPRAAKASASATTVFIPWAKGVRVVVSVPSASPYPGFRASTGKPVAWQKIRLKFLMMFRIDRFAATT